MGEVVAWRPRADRAETTARVGMLLCLAAWSMMFVSLLFTWVFVRAQAEVWPPPGTVDMPLWPAALATSCLVAGAGVFEAARWSVRSRRAKGWAVLLLSLSLLLLIAYFGLQIVTILEGRRLKMTGSFGSLFMTLLFFHAAFVVSGMPSFAVLLRRAQQGLYSPARHIGLKAWGLYWKYAAAVWLLLFGVLYVL